jgi:hypothetical protein
MQRLGSRLGLHLEGVEVCKLEVEGLPYRFDKLRAGGECVGTAIEEALYRLHDLSSGCKRKRRREIRLILV